MTSSTLERHLILRLGVARRTAATVFRPEVTLSS
jgi:hypothetical protein